MSVNQLTSDDSPAPSWAKVARRKATLVNLFFSYSSLGLTLIHGLLMVPLYLRFIDTSLYGTGLPPETSSIGLPSRRVGPHTS